MTHVRPEQREHQRNSIALVVIAIVTFFPELKTNFSKFHSIDGRCIARRTESLRSFESCTIQTVLYSVDSDFKLNHFASEVPTQMPLMQLLHSFGSCAFAFTDTSRFYVRVKRNGTAYKSESKQWPTLAGVPLLLRTIYSYKDLRLN